MLNVNKYWLEDTSLMNMACFMYFLMKLIMKFVLESVIGSKLLIFFFNEPIRLILCTSNFVVLN